MLYEFKNVSKIYKLNNTETYAIDNINLAIPESKIIVILGPSGSGKSTLLNLLSGIDTPSKGEIYFNEKRLDLLNKDDLTSYRRENLGFIFQSYNLVANLTVRENIELGKYLSNNPLNMKEIIKAVGLEEHKSKYPYQLSGGQMQRVAIARALVKNPIVLFCDEPTGALDEEMGKSILKMLQEINKKYETTIIIVTHNPSIADMGHMVIKMNSGKILEIKKNKTIKDAEDLRWA